MTLVTVNDCDSLSHARFMKQNTDIKRQKYHCCSVNQNVIYNCYDMQNMAV